MIPCEGSQRALMTGDKSIEDRGSPPFGRTAIWALAFAVGGYVLTTEGFFRPVPLRSEAALWMGQLWIEQRRALATVFASMLGALIGTLVSIAQFGMPHRADWRFTPYTWLLLLLTLVIVAVNLYGFLPALFWEPGD